jgi:hypothetical protein
MCQMRSLLCRRVDERQRSSAMLSIDQEIGIHGKAGTTRLTRSLEGLMRFLTALGYHIEIKIGAGKASKLGEVTIRDARPNAA